MALRQVFFLLAKRERYPQGRLYSVPLFERNTLQRTHGQAIVRGWSQQDILRDATPSLVDWMNASVCAANVCATALDRAHEQLQKEPGRRRSGCENSLVVDSGSDLWSQSVFTSVFSLVSNLPVLKASILKGTVSRYSVIFCACFERGKMATAHASVADIRP